MNHLAIIEPTVPVYSISDMERIATSIAKGGMFGSKDPHAVLTLCMLAQAEGQHPAVVFRDYDIIQGKPAKKAEAMLRDFIRSGGKVEWGTLDDTKAEATFSHPQGGSVTLDWTMDRAAKADLGKKEMWKKYPRQMLRSRLISEGVRTVYPGATSGLYVPEEVSDFGRDDAVATPPTPQAKRARDLTPINAATEAQPAPAIEQDKASAWAHTFISGVAKFEIETELDAFLKNYQAKLDDMEEKRPDLYDTVIDAIAEQRTQIAQAASAFEDDFTA